MNCHQVRKNLSAYLEGELSQARAIKIEAHLAECQQCRQLAEELKSISQSLASLPAVEPSPALLSKLYSIPGQVELESRPVIEERKRVSVFSRKFWLSPAFQPVLVSLTVILIVASLLFFTQPGHSVQKSVSLRIHRTYSQVQRVLVKAGVITDRLNGYRESFLASIRSDQLPKSDQN
ncbi:MAG TPA: zf-HC2 domain-containing protein [Candidatus Saccharicenans sp.]|nr:zf-HC2 domain-containing protein [Candidatus Saccharicenans sp.]